MLIDIAIEGYTAFTSQDHLSIFQYFSGKEKDSLKWVPSLNQDDVI